MPSVDKLFSLDPVKTTLAAPTTNVQVQGPENRSASNAQLTRGLSAFANSVGNLGEFQKQKQIIADIDTAEDAAIRGEQLPGGLLGIAEQSFDNIVDQNTANSVLAEIKAFEESSDGYDLVNHEAALSDKYKVANEKYDSFYQNGQVTIQSNAIKQDLATRVREARENIKRDITKVDLDIKKLQVVTRTESVVANVVEVNKANKQDFGREDLTRITDNLSKEVVALELGVGSQEAKLLVAQLFMQNPDIIGKPKFIREFLQAKFSKGITYQALYLKGIRVGNKDADATAFADIYTKYQAASADHSKAIEDREKDIAAFRQEEGERVMLDILNSGGTNARAISAAASFEISNAKALKIINNRESLVQLGGFGIGSEEGQDFKAQILKSGGVSSARVELLMIERGLSLSNKSYFTKLATVEDEEFKEAQAAYDESIKLVKSGAVSLLKNSLGSKNITFPDGSINPEALRSFLTSKGIDQSKIQSTLQTLQNINNKYANISAAASLATASNDTFGTLGAEVSKFSDDYNKEIAFTIDDIKNGIVTKEEQQKANEEAIAAKASAVFKKGEALFDSELNLTQDKRNLATNTATYVTENVKDIEGRLKAEQKTAKASKEKLISPVDHLSTKDQEFFNSLKDQSGPQGAPDPVAEHFSDRPHAATEFSASKFWDILKKDFDSSVLGSILSPSEAEGSETFDPEGEGFDMATALANGMKRDETGHMGSVVPTSPEQVKELGLPQDSFMLLKGKSHSTFPLAVDAERERGFKIIKKGDRFFSVPEDFQDFDPDSQGPRGFDKDNNPIEGGRNDLAEKLGLPVISNPDRKQTAVKPTGTEERLRRVRLEASEDSRVRGGAFKETGIIKVKSGDSLSSLAPPHKLTVTELRAFNGGTDKVFADRDIIVSSEQRSRLADFQDIPASVDVNRFKDLDGPIHIDNPKKTKLGYAKKISTQINPLLKSVFSSYKGILSSVKSDRKEAADLKGEHGTFALDYSLKEHFTKSNLVSESLKAIKVFKDKGFTITKTKAGSDFYKHKTINKDSKKKELSQVWFKMKGKDEETYTFEFTSQPSHIHIAPDMDERYKQHWPETKRTNPKRTNLIKPR